MVFTGNMGNKSQPTIIICKEGENWTKVTFKPDLQKFNMDHLEEDVVALMKKRVVDLAGTLGKTVKVELNGKRVPVKTFADYVNLYLQSASQSRPEPLPRIVEKVNHRWEICISLTDGQFQQVSFVNSINTIKGGTHVEYVTSQITSHVMSIVNKKNKNANLKPHNVKNHLWVFINCLVDNPAFDSQTKETLTTRQGSFGSKCELSQDFLKKVAKSGIVESLLSWADFKCDKELKKTDGTKSQKITGILKLDDATEAGGKNSDKCTLILTEGDSAKALAKAGVSVVGRNYYGVFPLRGKLLNVREASHTQIIENAEIQNIKQILGLQQGKQYDSVKGLRYGHLMIMTDQDHDGSHIKGLLINFIHFFWRDLLKIPSFLVEFVTPIVKATYKTGKVMSFYTMPEYESWRESLSGNATGWSIKYYKGLGTSTSIEGKEYFQDLQKHQKDFAWFDEQDGDSIELAFSKKKIEARKNWLRQFKPGTYLDHNERLISYSDFVNKELILFSMADLQRSIPSMVDGLKPGQRKILFCSFKRNFVKEIKVAQFSGYISKHSAYHHGEQSLVSTIIGMAQDFVGSNNINLLQPNGQFGTRDKGGKDNASARYIYTKLSPITRILFPKEDDRILDYMNEDGPSIEPTWYVPIIPMVLVNGSEGIGTGWSSYIPNYNPREIVQNIRHLLNAESMIPMNPWYRSFKGLIEKTTVKESGATYTIKGIIKEIDSTTVVITELPIQRWTEDYKGFLESSMTTTDKAKESFIKDYREYNDDTTVHFEVTLSEKNLIMAKQEGLEKTFKLITTIGTSNMHLFNQDGIIKKYDTPEQILEEFFHLRITYYEKRKKALLDNLELELLILDNKVRFILENVKGEIIVNNRKEAELILELQKKGFTPIPKKTKSTDVAIAGVTEETEESEETTEAVKGGVKPSDYDYLLSMDLKTFTCEKVQEYCAEKEKAVKVVEELRNSTPSSLWKKDLDALEKALDELERQDAEAEEARKPIKAKVGCGGVGNCKQALKKPGKNNAKASTATEPITVNSEIVQVVNKPKPRERQNKSTAKHVFVESDEVEELVSLKDRLAAYKLDSSPETSAMDTETVLETAVVAEVPKKRAATIKKSLTVVSDKDTDDEEEDYENGKPLERRKGGGVGKKPANATKAKTTTVRAKREAQAKPLLTQKRTSELLPIAANGVNSPEKKVRKIRPSPFSKKSGSFLNKSGINVSNSEAQLEDSVANARPKRENRTRAVYVESESEDENEDDDALSEYSNFEEEDDD